MEAGCPSAFKFCCADLPDVKDGDTVYKGNCVPLGDEIVSFDCEDALENIKDDDVFEQTTESDNHDEDENDDCSRVAYHRSCEIDICGFQGFKLKGKIIIEMVDNILDGTDVGGCTDEDDITDGIYKDSKKTENRVKLANDQTSMPP